MSLAALFLAFLCVLATASAVDRTFDVAINPLCPLPDVDCANFGLDPPYKNNLVYIRSENLVNNNSDTRQYRLFWSTIGAPTFIITGVSPSADKEINLDWMQFLEDPKPKPPFLRLNGERYAGLGFSKLIEYNDASNTGQITDAEKTLSYRLDRALWLNVSLDGNAAGLLGSFMATLHDPVPEGGSFNITIELRGHTDNGRAKINPRMLFTPSSISIRLILNNLPVHFANPRFALEVMFASNDSSKAEAVHSVAHSISDEFSPGIFTVERVGGSDTYLQWRPVVYVKTNPGVSDSTRSQTGSLLNITDLVDWNVTGWGMPYSLLQGITGIQGLGTSLVRTNISFGVTDDGYYNATSYQEWSCDIGIGQAPVDAVSSNVRLLIGIGVGIPVVLILFGGIYVAYLKLKKRKAASILLITEHTEGDGTFTS